MFIIKFLWERGHVVIIPGTLAVGPGSGSANACDDDRAKIK